MLLNRRNALINTGELNACTVFTHIAHTTRHVNKTAQRLEERKHEH